VPNEVVTTAPEDWLERYWLMEAKATDSGSGPDCPDGLYELILPFTVTRAFALPLICQYFLTGTPSLKKCHLFASIRCGPLGITIANL